MDEDKSKYANLAQNIGFWISILAQLAVPAKGHTNTFHQKTV
jgi:hypothetical protein